MSATRRALAGVALDLPRYSVAVLDGLAFFALGLGIGASLYGAPHSDRSDFTDSAGICVNCDCLRLLAPNLSGSLSLWRPNDECASGGFDDVFGDGVEVVDSQDAVDLGEEAVE